MLITLSPSKGQDLDTPGPSKKFTRPQALKDSELLIDMLRGLDSDEIRELMGVSDNIARLNVERYQAFSPPFH